MIHASSLEYIQHAVYTASEQHKQDYGAKVSSLLAELQHCYNDTCARTVFFMQSPPQLAAVLQHIQQLAVTILQRNSWIGWELCDLGAVLDITPWHTYSHAMVAYNALHFFDDGIDGHRMYKAIATPSIYGYLIEQGIGTREAAAASSMLGMAIMNESIHALLRSGCSNIAYALLRLATRVYTGMFAESLIQQPFSVETYNHIVSYKSIAYQMFLDHVFLHEIQPSLRAELLRINAHIVRLGQLVDDLMDDEDDKELGCMNILTIPSIQRSTVVTIATETLAAIWNESQQLPLPLCNAIAARIAEWVHFLQCEAQRMEAA